MQKAKVYDLPTRLFHGLFAVLFVTAFAIAKQVDDESPWFSQHMLLGLTLFVVATLRIVWGVVGSRYARFSSFPLNPMALVEYFRDILSGQGRRYFGHNPASAWAALAMIGLSLGLGLTGYLMSTGAKEDFEDVHELMANAFAFVVVAHIAGVILHGLRHQDGIAFSMIHGQKDSVEGAAPIPHSHPLWAMAMAGLVGLFAFHIYKNYDPIQSTTRVLGVSLQLGENETGGNESGEAGGKNGDGEHNDTDHDDDDG